MSYLLSSQIESRAQVFEIRGNRLVGRMRHQRNVVSVLGHFVTFAVSISTHIFLMSGLYLVSDNDELKRLQNLFYFCLTCIIFCVNPLIETMFSDTLRDSLFKMPQM